MNSRFFDFRAPCNQWCIISVFFYKYSKHVWQKFIILLCSVFLRPVRIDKTIVITLYSYIVRPTPCIIIIISGSFLYKNRVTIYNWP